MLKKRVLAKDTEFLQRLGEVFTHAEAQGAPNETVMNAFIIYKMLLNQQDSELLETMMSERFYLEVFGALEYNPEINQTVQESKYRNFLQNEAKYKECIDLGSSQEEVAQKAKLAYRINYLKDTALATGLDEPVINGMNTSINHINMELIQAVFLNDQIMDQVFKKFHSDEMKEKTDAIAFMQEIFNISKNFQLNIKMTIVGQLKESCDKFKIFEFMNECIKFYKKERAEPTLDK